MESAGANRVVFRRLSPAGSYAAAGALHPVRVQALSGIDLSHAGRSVTRMVSVPNWMLAVSAAAALGITMSMSANLTHQPARTQPAAVVQSNVSVVNPRVVWRGSAVIAESTNRVISTPDPRIATLQSQASGMNANLQQLQQENNALRNLSQQQSSTVSSAQSDLAASQDVLQGQAQDLQSRIDAVQQDMGDPLSKVQSAAKAAGDLVNQIRSLLGMPAAPTGS